MQVYIVEWKPELCERNHLRCERNQIEFSTHINFHGTNRKHLPQKSLLKIRKFVAECVYLGKFGKSKTNCCLYSRMRAGTSLYLIFFAEQTGNPFLSEILR